MFVVATKSTKLRSPMCCCSCAASPAVYQSPNQVAYAAPPAQVAYAAPANAAPPAPVAPPAPPSSAAQQAARGANLVSGPGQHTKEENAKVVADVARQLGVDPVLAVATMLTESGGNNREHTGDGGTSFGLFQLHEGGELPKDWYPGQPNHEKAFDPRENAQIALSYFAKLKDTYSGSLLAFKSQRPADQAKYEARINQNMEAARLLVG